MAASLKIWDNKENSIYAHYLKALIAATAKESVLEKLGKLSDNTIMKN